MEEQVDRNKAELWSLSIKDLFYKYVRFLPLFIVCVILAMAGAFLYLRYTQVTYSSTGTMFIQNDKQSASPDKVEDLLLGTGKTQNIQNEIEILKSRPMMARVVQKLGLTTSITAKGKIKDQNVYKATPFNFEVLTVADSLHSFSFTLSFMEGDNVLINQAKVSLNQVFRNNYGSFRITTTPLEHPQPSEYLISWAPVKAMAAAYAGSVTVQPKTANAGILAISMLASNPVLAGDVVNTLMSEYSAMNIEQNNFSTDQMISFINTRLQILNRELDSSQQKLLIFQQQNDLVNVDLQLADYFTSINEGDKTVLAQQTRLSIADMIEGYLRNGSQQYERIVVPSSLGLEDEVLNQMVGAYNKAQMDRKMLLEGNGAAGNPAVKETESQIENLRRSILENISNIKSSYRSSIDRLQSSNSRTQANIKAFPYKVKEYIELKRQVDIKLELVKQLEGKREEAAIARSSTISTSRVIDEAGSGGPVTPNRTAIQLIAFLVGIGVPGLFIFFRELLNDKISTRTDIERITSAPVVGEIGHSFNDDALIVTKTSRSMVAEQFRIVRSNLQYIIGKIERPVIMVTSSFSGEGKSFVSTNMGAVMAVTGKRTVILEFDIRKPKVLSGLNMNSGKGITNYIVGKEELKDLVIPVPDVDNLFVLPCGPIPPNPAELLLDDQISRMFEYLRANFDVIIIDTAPVGMVSDAATLGKFADCTLYLVRQGYTFKKQIALIDELYVQKKLPAISIVVNDVKIKSGYGYYGYGRYGYGYGYGNGYYEQEAPLTFRDKLKKSLGLTKQKNK